MNAAQGLGDVFGATTASYNNEQQAAATQALQANQRRVADALDSTKRQLLAAAEQATVAKNALKGADDATGALAAAQRAPQRVAALLAAMPQLLDARPDVRLLLVGGGPQEAALKNPTCVDEDTEELLAWFHAEVKRREQELPSQPAKAKRVIIEKGRTGNGEAGEYAGQEAH